MKTLRHHALILGSILLGHIVFFLPIVVFVVQPINQTAEDLLGGADKAGDHTVYAFITGSYNPDFPNPQHCFEYNIRYDWPSKAIKQIHDFWYRFHSYSKILYTLPLACWVGYFGNISRRKFWTAVVVSLLLFLGFPLLMVGLESWTLQGAGFHWCEPDPQFLVKGLSPFWPTILLSLLSTGLGIAAIRRVEHQGTVAK